MYAIAGNQGKGGIPIPTDNYNAVNVAFSSKREGIFKKLDVSNLAMISEGFGRRLVGKEFNFHKKVAREAKDGFQQTKKTVSSKQSRQTFVFV